MWIYLVSGPGASLSLKNLHGKLLSSKMAFIELPMKKDDVVTTSANIHFFSYKIGILAPHTSWMAERLKQHNASKKCFLNLIRSGCILLDDLDSSLGSGIKMLSATGWATGCSLVPWFTPQGLCTVSGCSLSSTPNSVWLWLGPSCPLC